MALGAAATAVVGVGAASAVLDAAVARVEGRKNRVARPLRRPSDRAAELHATLRIADLHADSLLWGRDLSRRSGRGHLDVPRLSEGNVALETLAMAVKTPRHLDLERNEPTSDDVIFVALAK
ncbi:MAG TPA: peptidase M19, partial [Candidatus Dormibacteraeota bacterium]|nr:peptidase M19 [Candidatus Dormibacteraeota bacterium]